MPPRGLRRAASKPALKPAVKSKHPKKNKISISEVINITKPDHDEVELLLKYAKDQRLQDSILSGETFSPVVKLGKISMPPPDIPASCLPNFSTDDQARAATQTLKLLQGGWGKRKTVSIFFWPGKFNLSVTIDGQQIPQVSPMYFLCVTLDNELCWIPHISQIQNKLLVNRHLLQLGKNLLNEQCLIGIYYAHIYSHLTYSLNT